MIAGNLTELQGAIEHQVVSSKDDTDAAVPFNEFLAAVATINDADQPRQLAAAEVTVEQEPSLEMEVAAFIHPFANPQVPAAEAVPEIIGGATIASPSTDITLDPITATTTAEIAATGETHSPQITPGNQLNLERVVDDQASSPQPAGPNAVTGEPASADVLAVEAEQVVPQHQAVAGEGTTLDGVVAVDQPELTLRQVAPTSQHRSDTSRAQIDEDNLTVDSGSTEVEPLPQALNGFDVSSERENSSDAAFSPPDDGFSSQPQRAQDPSSVAPTEIPQAISSPDHSAIRAEVSIESRPTIVPDIGTVSTQGIQARDVTEQVGVSHDSGDRSGGRIIGQDDVFGTEPG